MEENNKKYLAANSFPVINYEEIISLIKSGMPRYTIFKKYGIPSYFTFLNKIYKKLLDTEVTIEDAKRKKKEILVLLSLRQPRNKNASNKIVKMEKCSRKQKEESKDITVKESSNDRINNKDIILYTYKYISK